MKFLLILACLALYVAHVQAQRCLGLPPRGSDCNHGRDSGNHRERHCRNHANNNMWYYNRDRNECLSMSYLGCGGNNNRWCTKSECEGHCRRPR